MTTSELIPHDRALELLPWLVNGSLDDGEAAATREHALSCIVCHRELHDLERLQQSISNVASEMVRPAPDMRRINQRIDEHLVRANRWRDFLYRVNVIGHNPWRAAFLAQSLVLIVLAAAWLVPGPSRPEFTTLSNPVAIPGGPHLRALFSADMDSAMLSELLARHSLTVVTGPSIRGVYTLGITEALSERDYQQLIALLRARPDVLFAEDVSR